MAWTSQNPDPEIPRPASPAAAAAQGAVSPAPGGRADGTETRPMANIGKSLQIKGELSGGEDLTIDGTVEGKISLSGHRLTIGQSGRVTAEIGAKSILVSGELKGNASAEERVEVAATGTMRGDIRSPRVVLADGARFKGRIDMDGKPGSPVRVAAPER